MKKHLRSLDTGWIGALIAIVAFSVGPVETAHSRRPPRRGPRRSRPRHRKPAEVVVADPRRSTRSVEDPWDLGAGRGVRIHVTAVKGLDHPWGIAFVSGGDQLVTERPGRLRVIRNGVLDPTPIGPLPPMVAAGLGGLLDVSLHPQFATNHLIYLAYSKTRRRRWETRQPRSIARAGTAARRSPTARTSSSPGRSKRRRISLIGPASGSFGARFAWDKDGLALRLARRAERSSDGAGTWIAPRKDRAAQRRWERAERQSVHREGRYSLRCSRSAIETRSACTSIRSPAISGRPRKGRRAATS